MEEEETVSWRRRAPSEMLEERSLCPEHLHGARWKSGEPVQPPGLGDNACRKLGPQESGQVGGLQGGLSSHRLLERATRIRHGLIELPQTSASVEQSGVGGSQRRGRRSFGRGPRRAGMVSRVQVGEVVRDPAAEAFSEQVPHPVQVGGRADCLLHVNGGVPGFHERPVGILKESAREQRAVRDGDEGRKVDRRFGVEPKAEVGETSVPGHPAARLSPLEELYLLRGSPTFSSHPSPLSESRGVDRGRNARHHRVVLEEKGAEPGGDHVFHEPRDGARDK